jgi:hypothetical protein
MSDRARACIFVVAAAKWHDPRTLSPKAIGFLVLSGPIR